MTTLKQYFIATRPWSFPMSLISVSLGTLLAAAHERIHWGVFAAVAVAIVLTHAAGNVINDYFDSKNKVDQPDSPTARDRPHPIMGGMMSLRTLLLEAVVFLVLAGVIGLALAFLRSPHLFWIIAAGLVLTVFYTATPIAYKYSALGEIAIFLIWGPLMFEGAYVAQRQQLAREALIASVPFGVLVALVLFANNLRDIDYDKRSGINTIAILLGHQRSLVLFAGLMLSAYVYVALAVAVRALGPWTLLVFLSLPMAIGLLRSFRRGIPDEADAITAKLDTVFGLLFIAALVVEKLLGT